MSPTIELTLACGDYEIMRDRPEILSVVHTHAPYAVIFSSLGKPILPFGHSAAIFLENACWIQVMAEQAGGPRLFSPAGEARAKKRISRPEIQVNLFNYLVRRVRRELNGVRPVEAGIPITHVNVNGEHPNIVVASVFVNMFPCQRDSILVSIAFRGELHQLLFAILDYSSQRNKSVIIL